MTKIYCIKRNKCRKFENPIISYIFYKIFALSIICDKSSSKDIYGRRKHKSKI